ncbi:MAG: hypothetical protein EXQ77_04970 [Thermoleophilia bacterium]|nr:hypothetical protein [Thermoleophilia bacterium]
MGLTDQWRTLEGRLTSGWETTSLRIRPERKGDLAEVARLLGSMGAGRVGGEVAVTVQRAGGTQGPQAAVRLFARIDQAGLACRLGVESETSGLTAAAAPAEEQAPATASWDGALAGLPSDWSDALACFTVRSSDELDRAALLCAPLNPTRDGDALTFLFRCARRAGYGASAATTRRAFERLDAEGIPAEVSVLRVLSGTDNVGTQGTAWVVGGKHL